MRVQQTKRERDRRYDAKRRIEQPWRTLYFTREWRKLRAGVTRLVCGDCTDAAVVRQCLNGVTPI